MLHAKIMVNGQAIGEVRVTRREDMPPGGFSADAVNHYDWKVNHYVWEVDGTTRILAFSHRDANEPGKSVEHRYGDGAGVLLAKVLAASTGWVLVEKGKGDGDPK